MEITITARNFTLDEALKEYVHKRLGKMEHLYKRIYECKVILEEIKERKKVEVILSLKKHKVVAEEVSPDMYASIDNAAENIKKQLMKIHDKVSTKRRRSIVGTLLQPVFRMRRAGEIIETDLFADKPMSAEEAKLELEVMGHSFIMFKNAETGEVNVLYKRNDGNYGLIRPEF